MIGRRAIAAAAVIVAVVVAAGGCRAGGAASPSAPGGAADARAYVASIEVCKATEAELRGRLGAPTRDGRIGGARVVSWIVGEDDVVAYVAVLLDARGVVVDLYWDVPTEIPWTPVDRCNGAGA